MTAEELGDLAFERRLRLHELATQVPTLEEVFLEVTGGSEEFQAQAPGVTS